MAPQIPVIDNVQSDSTLAWYCIPCNEELDLPDRAAHLSSDVHTKNVHERRLVEVEREASGVKVEEQAKLQEVIPVAAEEPGELHCGICQQRFKATVNAIARHKRQGWECKICMKTVHLANKRRHESTSAHIQKKELLESKLEALTASAATTTIVDQSTGPQDAVSGAPDTSVTDKSNTSETSISEIPDCPEIPITEIPHTRPPPTGPEKIYCEICDNDFKPTESGLRVHSTPLWECNICDVKLHIVSKTIHQAGAKHAKRMRTCTESFYCEICDKELKTTKGSVRIHTTVKWDCAVCDITTHTAWKRRHIEGRKHEKNFKLLEKLGILPEGVTG